MKRIIIFLGLFLIPFISMSAQTTFISYDLPSDCYALQVGSFNNEIICLAAINGVYRSVNSGQNWSKVYGYPDSLISIRDISVINENTGYVVGEMNFKGLMLKTTDKGITWIRIPTPDINSFYGINFKDSKVCATGNNGKMLVSANQGNNWTLFQNEFSVWFNDICDVIVTENAIYSAYYDIKKTQDNINWNYVYSGGNWRPGFEGSFPTRWLYEDFEEEADQIIFGAKEQEKERKENAKIAKQKRIENRKILKESIKSKLTKEELLAIKFK